KPRKPAVGSRQKRRASRTSEVRFRETNLGPSSKNVRGSFFWLCEDVDLAQGAVDADARAIGDPLHRVARADDTRDAVLASDDRRVTQLAPALGHDRAEQRQDDIEV